MRELTAALRLDLRSLREVGLMAPIIIGVFWVLNWNSDPTWIATALMILIFMVIRSLFIRFGRLLA